MAFGLLGNLIHDQTPSQVDMSGPVGWGLSGVSMIPGPVGILGSLAKGGIRLNNASYADSARPSWGQEGLNFGQYLGAALGLNSYGQGGGNDQLGDFRRTAVTPSGMVDRGGFFGIGGETTGAYTPGEAQRHNAAALYGSSFGVPSQSSVAPASPLGNAPAPQQPAPSPAAPAPAPQSVPTPPPSTNILGTPQQADPFDRDGIARVLRDAGFGGGWNSGTQQGGGGSMGGRGGYGGRNSDGSTGGRSGADAGNRSSIN